MSVLFNSVSCLPNDITKGVLSHLGPQDLARCCEVCKLWKALVGDDLWQKVVPGIENFVWEGFKGYIDSYAVCSEKKLVSRFKKFLNSAGLNQRCQFTCMVPSDSKARLFVEFLYGHGDRSNGALPDKSQFCILLDAPRNSKDDDTTINGLPHTPVRFGTYNNTQLTYRRSPLDLLYGQSPGEILVIKTCFPELVEARSIDFQINRLLSARMSDLCNTHWCLNTGSWVVSVSAIASLASYMLYYSL